MGMGKLTTGSPQRPETLWPLGCPPRGCWGQPPCRRAPVLSLPLLLGLWPIVLPTDGMAVLAPTAVTHQLPQATVSPALWVGPFSTIPNLRDFWKPCSSFARPTPHFAKMVQSSQTLIQQNMTLSDSGQQQPLFGKQTVKQRLSGLHRNLPGSCCQGRYAEPCWYDPNQTHQDPHKQQPPATENMGSGL